MQRFKAAALSALALLGLESQQALAVKLQDYKPYNYEILFTFPKCGPYKYSGTVLSTSGKPLTQKPENTYCFNQTDRKASGDQPDSPQHRLVDWISDASTTEIYFTYLSFSNRAVKEALCNAAKTRNVKIRFTLDNQTDMTAAEDLVQCSPENIKVAQRGDEGGLGYGHNKIMMFNPNSQDETRIVFSSGNMTSGPVVHHENWHFIKTTMKSHFAQMHRCVLNSMWDEKTGRSRDTYIQAIRDCRRTISQTAAEEDDIKVFFIPGEGVDADILKSSGRRSATSWMLNGGNGTPGIRQATKIWMGAHRFFYTSMIRGLQDRMLGKKRPEMQLIADDDTYYKAVDSGYTTGDTSPEEWYNMKQLADAGAQIRFIESNPHEKQLHHSKYLLFADSEGFKSVLCGAANLTGAGFRTNFENIYFVMIPDVVKKFAELHEREWKLATAVEDLPAQGYVCEMIANKPANYNCSQK